jgi:hypothetical protein
MGRLMRLIISKRTPSVPDSIAELRAELEQFRSRHPPRTKLPQSVWKSATELARCRGIYVVARSLRLDYSTLKKHVSGSAEVSRYTADENRTEICRTDRCDTARVDEYLIEFESARGAKMRIH